MTAKGRGALTVKRIRVTLNSFLSYLDCTEGSSMGVPFRSLEYTPLNLYAWAESTGNCPATQKRNMDECTRFAKQKLGIVDF